jgi:hypothetical protein
MPTDCGGAANFCLVNPNYGVVPNSGSQFFCAPNCKQETDCPNGYNCNPVEVLTQNLCTSDTECGGGGRVCQKAEGDVKGACTCASDSDCPYDQVPPTCHNGMCAFPLFQACNVDTDCQATSLCADSGLGGKLCFTNALPCSSSADCVCSNGTCALTGRACSNANDCMIHCSGGGCLLGQACGPSKGLNCPILTAP